VPAHSTAASTKGTTKLDSLRGVNPTPLGGKVSIRKSPVFTEALVDTLEFERRARVRHPLTFNTIQGRN